MTPTNSADWVVFAIDHLLRLAEVMTAWPLLIAVGLVLFRTHIVLLISKVGEAFDRDRNIQANAGPLALSVTGQSSAMTTPVEVPQKVEVGGGDELAVVRDLLDRAEETATRWHFAYLTTYLAPHTMQILQWIAAQPSKPTQDELWGWWGRSVTTAEERGRVLSALMQHELLDENDDLRLVPTERAVAFLNWLTADRATVRVQSAPNPQENHAPPYTAYGTRLHSGALVEAVVRERVVASARSDTKGNWKLTLAQDISAGVIEGAAVFFRVDGLIQPQVVKWTSGGAPADAVNGILFPSAQPNLSVFFDEQVVTFAGGSIDEFDRFVRASGATGAWTVVNGQRVFRTFGNADDDLPFLNAFRNGIPSNTLVVLLRKKSQPV